MVLFLSKTPSCLYFKTQLFGDWVLSPSSGKTYLILLILIYYLHSVDQNMSEGHMSGSEGFQQEN
jgi:hypothetical protein